jgi:sulfate permease, SulP family
MTEQLNRFVPGQADLIAGVTVALVLVPQSVAYAHLAGVPAGAGLVAGALAALVGALLTASPHLQSGPTALTSLLTFGVVANSATPDAALHRAMLLALLIGGIRVLLALARAGPLSFLISEPILVGLLPGAAIVIAASQLPALLGVRVDRARGVFGGAEEALSHPGSWNGFALAVGAISLCAFAGSRTVSPRIPVVAATVLGTIVASHAFGFSGPTVGEISVPLGPALDALPWGATTSLLLPALVIAVVGFVEPTMIARSMPSDADTRWNPDRELFAQGMTNVVAGAGGGFPVGASLSRSALNRAVGARSRLSGLVTGIALLAFLPAAGLLSPLPESVPAALVIVAVLRLANPRPLITLARSSRIQLGVALTTLVLTIALTPRLDYAVGIAIVLAIVIHLWLETRVPLQIEQHGTRLILRPAGVLWFASAFRFEEAAMAAIEAHDCAEVVIRLDGLGRIDVTGARALVRCIELAERKGMRAQLDNVPAPAALLMGRLFAHTDPVGHTSDEDQAGRLRTKTP